VLPRKNKEEYKYMAVYEKAPGIEIEVIKNGREVVIRKTKTGKSLTFTKKPDVEILALFVEDSKWGWGCQDIATKLGISEEMVNQILKPLVQKGFISDLATTKASVLVILAITSPVLTLNIGNHQLFTKHGSDNF
jgi:predicted DNA-binding transcriptional regulator